MSSERRFRTETLIPRPLPEVFPFFADAKNLERITPDFLHFKILSQSTPEIGEGTEFKYQLKLRGFPIRWHSRIIEWNPQSSFKDIQLSGPYRKWEHLHEFIPEGEKTRMIDQVDYDLPLGALGRLFAGSFVDKDVKQIFEYREKVIQEYFRKS